MPASATSYHEAGHALVALAVGEPVYSLTINRDDSGAFRSIAPPAEPSRPVDLCDIAQRMKSLGGMNRIFNLLCVRLGGIAGSFAIGTPSWWEIACFDREEALAIARGATEGDRKSVYRLLDYALLRACSIIDRNRSPLDVLAEELTERGYLNSDEIKSTLARAGFPQTIERRTPDLRDWPATSRALAWRSKPRFREHLIGRT